MRSLVLLLLATLPNWAAVLTFEGNACSANSDGSGSLILCFDGAKFNASYGDTSYQQVTYSQEASSGGTLVPVATDGGKYFTGEALGSLSGSGTVYRASVTLAAFGGNPLLLRSFDIQASPEPSRFVAVVVRDAVTLDTLYSYGLQPLMVGESLHIAPALSSTRGYIIDYFDTQRWQGLDNLDTGIELVTGLVATPEPSSMVFAAIGSGLIFLSRRRR